MITSILLFTRPPYFISTQTESILKGHKSHEDLTRIWMISNLLLPLATLPSYKLRVSASQQGKLKKSPLIQCICLFPNASFLPVLHTLCAMAYVLQKALHTTPFASLLAVGRRYPLSFPSTAEPTPAGEEPHLLLREALVSNSQGHFKKCVGGRTREVYFRSMRT